MRFWSWIPSVLRESRWFLTLQVVLGAVGVVRALAGFGAELSFAANLPMPPLRAILQYPATGAFVIALLDWGFRRHRQRAALLPESMRAVVARSIASGFLLLLATVLGQGIGLLFTVRYELLGWVEWVRIAEEMWLPAAGIGLGYIVARVLLETSWILVVFGAVALAMDSGEILIVSSAFPVLILLSAVRIRAFDEDQPLPRHALIPGVLTMLVVLYLIDGFALREQFENDPRAVGFDEAVTAVSTRAFNDGRVPSPVVDGLDQVERYGLKPYSRHATIELPAVQMASLSGPLVELTRSLYGYEELELERAAELVHIDADGQLGWIGVGPRSILLQRPQCAPEAPVLESTTRLASWRPGEAFAGTPGRMFVERIKRQGESDEMPSRFLIERLELPAGARFESFVELGFLPPDELSEDGDPYWYNSSDIVRSLALKTDRGYFAPYRSSRPRWDGFDIDWEATGRVDLVECSPMRLAGLHYRRAEPGFSLESNDGRLTIDMPLLRPDEIDDDSQGAFSFVATLLASVRSPVVLVASALGDWTAPVGSDLAVRQNLFVLIVALAIWAAVWRWQRSFLRWQCAARGRRRFWDLMMVLGGPLVLVACMFSEWRGLGSYPQPLKQGTPRLRLRSEGLKDPQEVSV